MRRHVPYPSSAFAGFRFPADVVVVAVRWYLRYGLSYRDVEELLAERGVDVDHVTIYRWVQRFTPLLIEAARPCRHAVGDRWFVDETYVEVGPQCWRARVRVLGSGGFRGKVPNDARWARYPIRQRNTALDVDSGPRQGCCARILEGRPDGGCGMSGRGRLWRWAPPLLAVVVAVAAASGSAMALAGTTPISGSSPYPDGGDPTDPLAVTACNGEPQTGVLYRNSEAEPYLAVNPTDSDNMIAAWHQDRWSNGGAQGLGAAFTFDGGENWTSVNVPFTRCSGGEAGSAGDYGRASDPWISFGPDGTAHFMALVTDHVPNRNGMAVARSTDGGVTWTEPQIIKALPARDRVAASLFHDKNSITADPDDADRVYATWTLFRSGVTSLLVARSTDGGETWGPSIPIATFGNVGPAEVAFFRQGAQIVVLPDGTLVNAFYRILFDQRDLVLTWEQALFRSSDGRHWDRVDVAIDDFVPAVAIDPELSIPVRDAGEIPDIAVDDGTGALYVTWQRENPVSGVVEVVVSRSIDGGFTWAAPQRVSQEDDAVQSFLPAVSVNDDGTVGVLYYDFRNDVLGDAELSTDVHLALFDPDLDFIEERQLSAMSFDLRQMVITGSRGFFPGDYVGLDTAGDDFVAAFTAANDLGLPVDFPQPPGLFVDDNDRQDIVFVRETP